MNRGSRFGWLLCLFVVCAAVFGAAAYAASDYNYWAQYTNPGDGGGDLTVYYRNFNDSCSTAGYGSTRSIYGLSDGSWVATVDNFDECAYSKAHLGPSSNYGYTYVQSKCRNIDTVILGLYCRTTRP
jgi:hypothetical protein